MSEQSIEAAARVAGRGLWSLVSADSRAHSVLGVAAAEEASLDDKPLSSSHGNIGL